MNIKNFDEYQELATKTAIYGAGDRIIYPALGLVNEAGEVAGKVKKVLRDNHGEFTEYARAEIAKEVGDVLWYCAALLRDLDIALSDVAAQNIQKLLDRQARGVIQGSGDNR